MNMFGRITGVAFLLGSAACFSPTGAYRELRSDRHKPNPSDLVGGIWRVIPDSAKAAASTGLPLADLQAGFVSFQPDGRCSGDLYAMPCGHFPSPGHHKATEACRWTVSTFDKPTIILTFGEGGQSDTIELHRLESQPPILWQYVCDPDWADYVEFERVQH
jgi:hypothetical protein